MERICGKILNYIANDELALLTSCRLSPTSTFAPISCKLQFIGGIINELAVTNLGGYGVSP